MENVGGEWVLEMGVGGGQDGSRRSCEISLVGGGKGRDGGEGGGGGVFFFKRKTAYGSSL